MQKQISKIRSAGFTKINQLVRAHAHLKEIRPAFAEWQAGEIFICKKTGAYRYRFGERSKSITPWSATVEKLFSSPAAFAFAALVLAPETNESITQPLALPATAVERANVIALAHAA